MPLRSIADGLWCADGHFDTPLFRGSTRMTAVRGADGRIVLYSPVALTPGDRDALASIGPVAAIVSPNLYHHLYLRAAAEAFPTARVWIPEGLEARIGPIPRAQATTRAHPPALPSGIDHFIFDRHAARETLLFHRASATLVTSDLLYNYQPEQGRGEKAFFRLMGCYGAPKVVFYHRFAIREKAAVRELLAQVHRWAPRRIVMSHGRILESDNAAQLFAAAWRKLA